MLLIDHLIEIITWANPKVKWIGREINAGNDVRADKHKLLARGVLVFVILVEDRLYGKRAAKGCAIDAVADPNQAHFVLMAIDNQRVFQEFRGPLPVRG